MLGCEPRLLDHDEHDFFIFSQPEDDTQASTARTATSIFRRISSNCLPFAPGWDSHRPRPAFGNLEEKESKHSYTNSALVFFLTGTHTSYTHTFKLTHPHTTGMKYGCYTLFWEVFPNKAHKLDWKWKKSGRHTQIHTEHEAELEEKAFRYLTQSSQK